MADIVQHLDRRSDKDLTPRTEVGTLLRTNPGQKEAEVTKLDKGALVLAVVGALNWGLVAIAEFDLVAWIFGMEFGETSAASRVVYGLVGLSAIYLVARIPALFRSRAATGRTNVQSVAA
jgi:uncharacterized membrane protein YuzA (DUF378 family)